ncbi:hypothetical protein, partial [Geminicoccus flavidas]|uniref:hypothetical protein n=1 Tax=Geminicoccus flavidas TaxID=2506407 RepID=UPI00190F8CE3
GQSLATKKRLADLHERLRGRGLCLSDESRAAMARGAEKGREKRCTKYTAFGVTGYLPELAKRFGAVSHKSVRARLQKGMAIEEALTAPYKPNPRGVIPPAFLEQVYKQRRAAAARIYPIIAKRLQPTMLQFRSSDHEIVVTQCELSHMAVDVRTRDGVVLHRLRFEKSFDSGVLFVFNDTTKGLLDFIAFEPDSPALVATA